MKPRRTKALFFRVTEKEFEEFHNEADKRQMNQSDLFRYFWNAFKDAFVKEDRLA